MVLLYKIINSFWKKRTLTEKILIIGLFLFSLYALYQGTQKAYYKYKYINSQIERIESLQTRIATLELRSEREIENISKSVKRSRKSSNATNKKRIEDEKIIDNKPVSDNELNDFLSKYEISVSRNYPLEGKDFSFQYFFRLYTKNSVCK